MKRLVKTMLVALMVAAGSININTAEAMFPEYAFINVPADPYPVESSDMASQQSARTQGTASSQAASETAAYSEKTEEILKLVNMERQKEGLAPLRLTKELMAAAAIRAKELTINFSHTRPNGEVATAMIIEGARTVGENIAAGHESAEATMKDWMNSPGHRANILNPAYTELGVGYVFAEGTEYRHYWVQMFKRPR